VVTEKRFFFFSPTRPFAEIDIVETFILSHTMFMSTEKVIEESLARFRTVGPQEASNKEKVM